MANLKYSLKKLFPLSLRDALITLGIIASVSLLCFFLQTISDTDFHVPLIFVLAVLLVSFLTNGYFYGFLTCIVAVFGVNYVFTYPYFQFNFSLSGYPLTFVCSFAVCIITSTLTTRVRESEKIRMEGEREKLRANLLRAISHDFRTPLTSIIGTFNVLEEDPSLNEDERRSMIADARSDAEWLVNMVENLLSITRISASNTSGTALHKELQVAEEIVGDAVAKFRRQYPKLPVDIRIPQEFLMIPMDATLIEQVLINLLANVVHHAKIATGATLSLTCEKDMAVFCVSDDGKGFPPEMLPRLFHEGFLHQDKHSSHDAGRNMGIGLSVCSAIVKAHGGTLAAENLRPGAAVRFTLPLETSLMEDYYGDSTENFDY